jgi:hypothetical protein
MPVEESEIKVSTIYETAGGQRRKVLRLTPLHVIYEILGSGPPFYRVSVLKRKFAADAVKEISRKN